MIDLPVGVVHLWRFLPDAGDAVREPAADRLSRSRERVLRTVALYREITPGERADGRCIRSTPGSNVNEPAIVHSVSRSGGATVLALAHGRAIGVDLERLDPSFPWGSIVRRLFAPGERADIRSRSADRRLASFYKAWTSKEAYLKGLGLGLSGPLRDFTVCCDPAAPPELRSGLPGAAPGWTLLPLFDPPRPGWTGAIAVCGDAPVLLMTNETRD